MKVWDAETGQKLLTLKATHQAERQRVLQPRRQTPRYSTWEHEAYRSRRVKVWDAEKGQELLTLKGHTGFVRSVCFSPDGKRLASAAGTRRLEVWDAETGQELLTLKGHTAQVSSVCFSPDGKRLASASWDKTVKVWDAEKGQELLTLKGHTGLSEERVLQPRRQATCQRLRGQDGEGVVPGREAVRTGRTNSRHAGARGTGLPANGAL